MKAELFNTIGDELARGITLYIAIASVLAILAIVFLQSTLDKIFDYQGNASWLKGHFSATPLRSLVGFLLSALIVLEGLAGVFCTCGFFQLLFLNDVSFGVLGLTFSSLSLLALMFGQRIAKDYAGAGGLVPYFIVVIMGFIMIYVI
ncbi:MAG TPA: DoxX family protein [Luteibaculaceae bacterium]|nr:DoxX family protein [Luteibaculaceae bacterium]